MLNKKGLSNIVATVLIVLLTLAAIAIVWSFLGPTITDAGETVDISSLCLNTELKPSSCIFQETKNYPILNVELVRGQPDFMLITVENGKGEIVTSDYLEPPAETLEVDSTTTEALFAGASYTDGLIKVQAVPVFLDENGERVTCDPSPTTAVCSINVDEIPDTEWVPQGNIYVPSNDNSGGSPGGSNPDPSTPAVCGDGNAELDKGEQCDDGNTDDGDECSSTCELEITQDSCNDDGFCDISSGESVTSCPTDCPDTGPTCNENGLCETGETVGECPLDCVFVLNLNRNYIDVFNPESDVICGDDYCDAEGGETFENCKADCQSVPQP